MALKLDNEEDVQVVNANTYKITNFMVDIPALTLVIQYNKMSVDSEGVETFVKSEVLPVSGNEFLMIVGAPSDGTKNHYENIKASLYAHILNHTGQSGVVS